MFLVFAQAHCNVRHLLRRMCRPLLALEMLMRTLQGCHLSWLLVLWLLRAARVHHLVAELLKLLL
jgi:hypothetical protein